MPKGSTGPADKLSMRRNKLVIRVRKIDKKTKDRLEALGFLVMICNEGALCSNLKI